MILVAVTFLATTLAGMLAELGGAIRHTGRFGQ